MSVARTEMEAEGKTDKTEVVEERESQEHKYQRLSETLI